MKRSGGAGLYPTVTPYEDPPTPIDLRGLIAEKVPGASVREGDRGVEVVLDGRTAYVREHLRRDEHALVILSLIGPESLASPRVMLELAGVMGCGGLALVESRYVVRAAIPMARIDQVSIGDAIAYVARLAQLLANRLHVLRPDVSVFTNSYGGE